MSAAELSLFVFLVAGALSRLLDLNFVVAKLRNRARVSLLMRLWKALFAILLRPSVPAKDAMLMVVV
jgi:hypothetical protein